MSGSESNWLWYGENGFGMFRTDGGAVERQPFNDTPFSIPGGRIPATEFDHGGEGIAFHETSERASWGVSDYRPGVPVDIKASPDDSSEYAIGRFLADEWLTYSTSVEPGTYELRARVGTALEGRQLSVGLGETQLATLDVPPQGDWATYTTVSTEVTIEGTAGERTLRLSPTQDGVDVAWVEFVPVDQPDPEPTPEHATVEIAAGGQTYRVAMLGTPPGEVSAAVTDGIETDVTLSLGDVSQLLDDTRAV